MPIVPTPVLTPVAPAAPTAMVNVAAAATVWRVSGVPAPIIARLVASPPAPYGTVPSAAVAILTNTARTNLARMTVEGLGFAVTEFQVGRGGYNPNDPTQATAPNPAAVALIDPVWPGTATYELIDSIEYPNSAAAAFLCRLEWTEALHGLGEIGLWATVTASPLFPAEVGTKFLFAIAHVPLQAKTANHVYGWRIVVAP